MNRYNVLISSRAQQDLADCIGFVLNVSKDSTKKLQQDIKEAMKSLAVLPERNPIFDMPKPFQNSFHKHVINRRYILVYSIENSNVIIYRILDTRRRFEYILF